MKQIRLNLRLLFCMLAVLFAFTAQAFASSTTKSTCGDGFTDPNFDALAARLKAIPQPPSILRTANREIQPYQYDLIGEIVRDPGFFENRRDEQYLFLIDSNFNVIVSERTPHLDAPLTGPHLATHTALYNKLRATLKEAGTDAEPTILAAGEYKITHNRVSWINNKSGSFHGSLLNLNFATKVLSLKGLHIEEKTMLRDAAKKEFDILHTSERQLSSYDIMYRNDLAYKDVALFYAQLYKAFPDAETPGYADRKAISKILRPLISTKEDASLKLPEGTAARLKLSKEVEYLMSGVYYIGTIQTEGIGFVLRRQLTNDPNTPISDYLAVIRSALNLPQPQSF